MVWFDKSVMLFGCIVEVFLLFDYFRNFFEFRLKKKAIITVFVITCLALFGINLIGNATANLIIFPLLMWTFVSVLFESKLGVRIRYFVVAYIFMTGIEFLFLILSQNISKISLKIVVVPVSDYGWQIVVIKFIKFIAFLCLKQTLDMSHSKMTNKMFYIYLCVPITTLGTMLTVFYFDDEFAGHITLQTEMTLFFVFMVLSNMILFYVLQKNTKYINKLARHEVELIHKNAEIERLTKIVELKDDYNETVHNMTHSLKAIEQLAMEHNMENILKIVEDLTGRLAQRTIYEYSNHRMINTILSEYVTKAEKNGVIQTTKKGEGIHGIGLKSIAKTVEKYKGSFSYYTEDKKFYVALILPVE